jgi:hypothetical protein
MADGYWQSQDDMLILTLHIDGVYAEDNYGKTRLDEKHPYFSPYGQPLVVLIHSR